jgi:hypothetical protein
MNKVLVRGHRRNGKSVKPHYRKLNQPFKSNRKYKKKQVYVKDDDGNIINVHYGDNRYEDYTQHGDPERRKLFRARHRCDDAKDKTTARHWACKELW